MLSRELTIGFTPQQSLEFHKPAFLDLFKRDELDLARFLRLVVDILDPDPGHPARCKGDGDILPAGCGELVEFKTLVEGSNPIGYVCPKCQAIFLYSMTKGMKSKPSKIVIETDGSGHVGTIKSESSSGTIITDGIR